MAAVPYEHVEAPRALTVNGVRAFNEGDPVPIDTAKRLGILDEKPKLEVFPATEAGPALVDGEIVLDDNAAPTSGPVSKTPGKTT
jgi:hypothetical protein